MMLSKEQLLEAFQRIATEVAERQLPKLSPSTQFSELGLDSLRTLEIIAAMEREFKIQIPDDELVGLNTINDLTDLVQRRMRASSS